MMKRPSLRFFRLCRLVAGLVLASTMPPLAGSLDVTCTAPTTKADGSALTDLSSYRVYYRFRSGTPVTLSAIAADDSTFTGLRRERADADHRALLGGAHRGVNNNAYQVDRGRADNRQAGGASRSSPAARCRGSCTRAWDAG